MVYKLSRGNNENRKEASRLRYDTCASHTRTWVVTCNLDNLSVKDSLPQFLGMLSQVAFHCPARPFRDCFIAAE